MVFKQCSGMNGRTSVLPGPAPYFFAFCFAHRFRCAAAIRSRASALITRFFLTFVLKGLGTPPPPKMLRTCFSLAISWSTASMIDALSLQLSF